MEYLSEFGYLGLFLASFLAATILPLSSEIVLTFLLFNDYNPIILVAVATTGNVLGSITNYLIGFYGGVYFVKKILKLSDQEYSKGKERFEKYGIGSLLFAWVPIIGDPLTVIAGLLKINFLLFIILVTIGKFARYIIIAFPFIN